MNHLRQLILAVAVAAFVTVAVVLTGGREDRAVALRRELFKVRSEIAIYPITHSREDMDVAYTLWELGHGRPVTTKEVRDYVAGMNQPYLDLLARKMELESQLEKLKP